MESHARNDLSSYGTCNNLPIDPAFSGEPVGLGLCRRSKVWPRDRPLNRPGRTCYYFDSLCATARWRIPLPEDFARCH